MASTRQRWALYLTPLHGRADMLRKLIANIGAPLQYVKPNAKRIKDLDQWGCLQCHITDRIAPVTGPPKSAPGLPATE